MLLPSFRTLELSSNLKSRCQPLFLALLLTAGCQPIDWSKYAPKPESPKVTVSEKGAVTLSGDTSKPADVKTATSTGSMTLPEGSSIVFNEKLGTLSVVMAKASQIALNRTETAVKGPEAFEPAKPPSAQEIADAEAEASTKKKLYLALFAGLALAIFGLVRHWDLVMYGGGAIALAAYIGLVVVKSLKDHPWIGQVITAGIVLAVAGPLVYHLKIKKLEKPNDSTNSSSG